MVTRAVAVLLLTMLAVPATAQESRFQSDLRREGDDLRKSCGAGFDVKALIGCVVTVATDDPFHVAVGSLPPLNGMGFGLAFSEHYTPNERWRLTWDADSVVSTGGAWRAGAYMKLIHIPERRAISVVQPGAATPPAQPPSVTITEYPVFNIYAQTISLDTLRLADQHTFSEHQTIIGGSAIVPLTGVDALRPLRPSVIAAVNGRFLDVQSADIGFSAQPAFAQFEEGLRVKPSAFDGRLRFNYLLDLQQFVASADDHASFHRWTIDLKHEVPFYRTVSSSIGPKDTNGPDSCAASVGSPACPPVSYSRNLEGSANVRLLATGSAGSAGSQVPFYLQPTLGGSDINGQRLLSAYDDYRFRGPNLIALQESVEHSIWGPVGAYLLLEQGKVTPEGEGLGFGSFAHSVAVGLTLRAGGFPLVNLTFAWGADSHHIIGSIDPSLLGGSSRPSLY